VTLYSPLTLKRLLIRSGVGFWLPLALVGVGFWLGGQAWTTYYLRAANRGIEPLAVASHATAQDHGLLSIRATLNGQLPFTRIEVIVVQPVPRTLKFLLPLDAPSDIEAELGNQLQVPPEVIRRLIRYENTYPF
jgi:hypothetical protein